MSLDTTNCIATVDGTVPASSSEAAKRETVVRMWRSGKYNSIDTVAAKTFQGTIPDERSPNRDPFTGDTSVAGRQRERWLSWLRRVRRWCYVEAA